MKLFRIIIQILLFVSILLAGIKSDACETPSATIDADKDAVCVGEPVTISIVTSENVVRGDWNFGLDANPATASDDEEVQVVYPTAGEKSITLIVENNIGTRRYATPNPLTINVYSALSAVNISPAANQAFCTGTTGTQLSVAETGGGPITSRQWGRRSSSGGAITPISGATGQTFTPSLANLGIGTWYVVCTSTPTCGSQLTSNDVVVTIAVQPTGPTLNLKTPDLTNVCIGTGVSATFNSGSGGIGCSDDYILIIDGGTPLTYTPGSTVGTTATSSIEIQGRRANCTLGNGCTGTSYTTLANWNIFPYPTITSQPNDVIVCEGEPTSIDVIASGSSLSYQWEYSPLGVTWDPVPTMTGVSGITSNELIIAEMPYSYNGYFVRCVISNYDCAIESDPAQITVRRFNVHVSEPTMTYCPLLSDSTEPPFQAKTDEYDAGATIVEITVSPEYDYSAGWSFDFSISGTIIGPGTISDFTLLTVGANATLSPSGSITAGTIVVNDNNPVILNFHVKNTPGYQQEINFDISNITNNLSCEETTTTSGSDNTSLNTILPMPEIGQFQ